MEDNGKKVIQISLGKFIILIILLIVVLVLGIGLYVNALKKSNTDTEMQAMDKKENSVNEIAKNENSIDVDGEQVISDNETTTATPNEKDTENNKNLTFTEKEIKECLQNYLDLVAALEASPEKFLNELNLLSEDDLYKGKNNVGKDGYVKTNIPYSKYKTEMMKYVTEEVFNERFTFCFKEVDGLLCWVGGGSGSTYIVDSITLKGDYSDYRYIARVKYAGVDDVFNTINVEFQIDSYNGKCVISYCDY